VKTRDGSSNVEPYPSTSGRKVVLMTNRRGEKFAFRRSPYAPHMLESTRLARYGDEPSFGAEPPIPGHLLPEVYELLAMGGGGGDQGPQVAAAPTPTATGTLFTINGSTTPGQIIGFPHNIALSAIVTFFGGSRRPAAPGESVQFFAQLQSGGTVFKFDTETLTTSSPFTAANPVFNINPGNGFAAGNIYNTWAIYPGDALNLTSMSNVVVLNIAGG